MPSASLDELDLGVILRWFRFEARNSKGITSKGDTTNVWIDTTYNDLKFVSEKQTFSNRKRS